MQKQLGIRMRAKRAAMLADNPVNIPNEEEEEEEKDDNDDIKEIEDDSSDSNDNEESEVDKENVKLFINKDLEKKNFSSY